MASIKQISERISYKQHEGFSTVVISPRLDDRKQLLLTFWVFAWTFSGLLFIAQLFLDYPVEMKRMIVAFLVFWLYYEYRIGYVWLWRRKGVELLKIEEGRLIYKRSVRTYGKAYEYYIDNIKEFGLAEIKPGFSNVLADSFWVIGGERLRFLYQDREVRFGVQLSEEEAEKLRKFLNEKFVEELKRLKEKSSEN
ncbi:MAG: hypothetical protein ACK40M_09905 [Flavobacteriales bacterium]|nr:hypothetical protein [Flavobacteriales bacterium]HRJ36150.1 hypothetical protein [Flavobacteriales bacterium]